MIVVNKLQALVGKGWRRVSDNHFYRFESSPVTPICHVISVIHLPLLRSFRQVCLEDLESIVRLTGSLFYLRFNNALTNPATLSALQVSELLMSLRIYIVVITAGP
jgi:hypothetical protein